MIKTPCLIVLREKHYTYHFLAPDPENLAARLIAIVRARWKAGYYEGADEEVAQAIVKFKDGPGAEALLKRWSMNEYEGFELKALDKTYVPS